MENPRTNERDRRDMENPKTIKRKYIEKRDMENPKTIKQKYKN